MKMLSPLERMMRVEEERGLDAARAFRASLPPDERAALDADFDQRWAAFRDALPVLAEAARAQVEALRQLAAAYRRVGDALRRVRIR